MHFTSTASAKSKLGCRTCRSRKIKCDETLPVCLRCSSSGRKCDGPFRNKFVMVNANKSVSRQCSPIPELTTDEARAFDYFLHKAAPILAGGLDAPFWKVILPRFSHENPAIRYAVLTISQLFEKPAIMSDSSLEWYTRSLASFNSKVPSPRDHNDAIQIVLSCIIFATIEFQQHNAYNACNLLQSGLSLIDNSNMHSTDETTRIMMQMMLRQRMLLFMWGRRPSSDPLDNSILQIDTSQEYLTTARDDLCDILYRVMRLVITINTVRVQILVEQKDGLIVEQAMLLERLESWRSSFAQRQANYSYYEDVAATTMLLHYEIAFIWASTCTESEWVTDQFTHRFEKILTLATQIQEQKQSYAIPMANFSFELGTIIPLVWTGWKCRDRALRRRALHLMSRGSRQEALFRAQTDAKTLENIIDIEQRSIAEGREARITRVVVQYETYEGVKVTPNLVYDLEFKDGSFLRNQRILL